MDGKPSGSTLLYTAPIRLDGVAGENINTTIQAIAVKDGMQDSVISSFTYMISIPAVRYTILASAGAHGTISPDGVTEVAEGESQTFVITLEEGYEIKTLRIDGAEEAVTGQYTFSDVRADHTIEAVFGRKEAPAPTPKPEPQPDPEPEPEPQPDPDPVTYKILEGADSLWVLNSDGSLTIRGEGELSKFVEIRLDGTVVDKKNYTVTEGSTIITLKADYLKTLSLGKHSLEMIWSDGSAGTTLTVTETAYDGNDKKKDSSEDDNNSRKNDGISDGTGNAGNGAASDKQDNNTGTVSQAATIRTGDASPVYLLITLLCASGIFLIGARHRSKEK